MRSLKLVVVDRKEEYENLLLWIVLIRTEFATEEGC